MISIGGVVYSLLSSDGYSPHPSLVITPTLFFKCVNYCANNKMEDVLPFVPVIPIVFALCLYLLRSTRNR